MGCRLDQCPRSFHKYCAQQAGCTFYPDHYLIACKDHAHMYKADDPPEGCALLLASALYLYHTCHFSKLGGLHLLPLVRFCRLKINLGKAVHVGRSLFSMLSTAMCFNLCKIAYWFTTGESHASHLRGYLLHLS